MIRRTSSACSGNVKPSRRTYPISAVSRVDRTRIKDDLPEPFGPRSPYVSPCPTLNETSSIAQSSDFLRKPFRLRKPLRRLRTSMAGCCMIKPQNGSSETSIRRHTSVVVGFRKGAAEPDSGSDQPDFEEVENLHRIHLIDVRIIHIL